MVIAISSCGDVDRRVPWDVADLARDVSADLRKFERLNSDFAEAEVLAWRRAESGIVQSFPPTAPIPPPKDRVGIVLLWGRLSRTNGSAFWALAQVFRRPDSAASKWQRGLFVAEISISEQPRPGSTSDSTWHWFQQYMQPPTSYDICTFASLHFLPAPFASYRTIDAAIQRNTWRRVAGAESTCGLEW
jgi:hypothetical protein